MPDGAAPVTTKFALELHRGTKTSDKVNSGRSEHFHA